MPLDSEIKRAFEIGDDGMQGVIGNFYYVKACQGVALEREILQNLPNSAKEEPSFRLTYAWVRHYEPRELCEVMRKVFLYYHVRMSIISLISIFEGVLSNFIERLRETGQMTTSLLSYKKRLAWAFNEAKYSETMKTQKNLLPDICLHVDHARRIRNLWMHNNGLFDDLYETNYIPVDSRGPILLPSYQTFKNTRQPTPIILNEDDFGRLSVCHITLLHHLNDAIQRRHFNATEGYSYLDEGKGIEWHRCLVGI